MSASSDIRAGELPRVYAERAYPEHARWTITAESPAGDGWVFARELTIGCELAFPPGALVELEAVPA